MDKLHTPIGTVARHWEDLVDDVEVTAAEYRDDGAEVLVLHPGDVTVGTDDRVGLTVMVPDDEADELEAIVARTTLDTGRVLRRSVEEAVFLLVVLEDESAGEVVLCPMFYGESAADRLAARSREEGELVTRLRRLDGTTVATFRHDDPAPFLPGQSASSGE